jgi:hypothetical protein
MMDYHKYLECDPNAGTLTYKRRSIEDCPSKRSASVFNKKHAGKIAGVKTTHGYISCSVNKKIVYAHRIIWEMTNGPIPKGMHIDHIDGNPLNNKISNLRVCTRSQNMANCRASKINKTGTKGVYLCKKDNIYVSRLKINGVIVMDKRFKNLNDAVTARKMAEIEYQKEFRRMY